MPRYEFKIGRYIEDFEEWESLEGTKHEKKNKLLNHFGSLGYDLQFDDYHWIFKKTIPDEGDL